MLICDKRRPASREQPDTSPPEGGDCPPFAHPSVGCALRLRRPARRLGRLHGRGLHPQTPGRASPPRYGLNGQQRPPSRSAGQEEKASEARRPKAGGLFGCWGKFLKKPRRAAKRGGVWGGVPPQAVEGWSTGLSRWAVSGQRIALSTPSTGDPGCPRRNGPPGAALEYQRKTALSGRCVGSWVIASVSGHH